LSAGAPTETRPEAWQDSNEDTAAGTSWRRRWLLPLVLMAATLASTLYVGAEMALERAPASLAEVGAGASYALPLMAILLAHEFGHFLAGKYHHVDVSPPYFIPLPFPPLGTMGAIIRMHGRIRSRNALLDIGAAGPLAGMAVALPVLIYGLAHSEVLPLPTDGSSFLIEGRSLLYLALLHGMHHIPEGSDIFLGPTAWAGWVGLLVTMINLVPFGQLDGGHVAYALWGQRQDAVSRKLLLVLPMIAVAVAAFYGIPAYLAGVRGDALVTVLLAGVHWLTWAMVLGLMTLFAGSSHPPTEDATLSPRRRVVAIFTLALFALLFMPSWMRIT